MPKSQDLAPPEDHPSWALFGCLGHAMSCYHTGKLAPVLSVSLRNMLDEFSQSLSTKETSDELWYSHRFELAM